MDDVDAGRQFPEGERHPGGAGHPPDDHLAEAEGRRHTPLGVRPGEGADVPRGRVRPSGLSSGMVARRPRWGRGASAVAAARLQGSGKADSGRAFIQSERRVGPRRAGRKGEGEEVRHVGVAPEAGADLPSGA